MIKFLLLSFIVAGAFAMGPPHGPPPHGKGYNPYHDAPAHYQYGYKVNDEYHGVDFGHEEKREGKYTEGVYHVLLPDGRVQTVKYNVDGYGGYVADVSYSGKGYAPPPHKPHKPVYHPPPPPPPPHKPVYHPPPPPKPHYGPPPKPHYGPPPHHG